VVDGPPGVTATTEEVTVFCLLVATVTVAFDGLDLVFLEVGYGGGEETGTGGAVVFEYQVVGAGGAGGASEPVGAWIWPSKIWEIGAYVVVPAMEWLAMPATTAATETEKRMLRLLGYLVVLW